MCGHIFMDPRSYGEMIISWVPLWRDDHWYWWKEREYLDEFGLRCGTKGPLPNGEPGQQAWQS